MALIGILPPAGPLADNLESRILKHLGRGEEQEREESLITSSSSSSSSSRLCTEIMTDVDDVGKVREVGGRGRGEGGKGEK